MQRTILYLSGLLVICSLSFCTQTEELIPEGNASAETPANEEETPPETPEDPTDPDPDPDPAPLPSGTPRLTNMRNFIFGHSLINHTPPLIPTPSDETSVPHWMGALSNAAGYEYSVGGQYGFLLQHADVPPTPQWGFQDVQGAWDGDTMSFQDANFNTILLTAANFVQYQPSTSPYDGENPRNLSPVTATLNIIDWLNTQEEDLTIYVYENWPDMDSRTSFPPSAMALQEYNEHTVGEFHDWWIVYHDAVRAARPDANVKMIPVGPILSRLLTDTALRDIPVAHTNLEVGLYEDGAPHGAPTLYFLAGLITYSAMYGVQPPSNFTVPDIVHPLVREHYTTTVNFIWTELQNFNDPQGNSRVW